MSDNTANAAITGTGWLILPEELRTEVWRIFDKEVPLSLDKYLIQYLSNRYRLKLKDYYPDMPPKALRAKLIEFRKRLGDDQV